MEPWVAWVYESTFLRLRRDRCRLPDGRIAPGHYVIDQKDFSMVVAITPAREVLVVREYKHGVGAVLLQLPAGFVEVGEDPAAAARRELAEETGYTAARVEHLGSFPLFPSLFASRGHFFLARDARLTGAPHLDEFEVVEVERLGFDDLVAGRLTEKPEDIASVLALRLAEARLAGAAGRSLS
jgi:ADP-ribose pyrophosphatase